MSKLCCNGHGWINNERCMECNSPAERTYTESELAAERAALLRKAIAECDVRLYAGIKNTELLNAREAIAAIPTDQSALARVEAAYEHWKKESVEQIREDETGVFEGIAARAIERMHQSPNGWTTEYILAAMRDAILTLQDRGREADNEQ